MRAILIFLTVSLIASAVNGCFLAADREINLDIVYPTPQQSEVTVKYRVPPPPTGKVYVLWVVNPDLGRQAKIGELQPAKQLRAVRTTVDFPALGAIVSIESDPGVSKMSDTWALKAGQTEPSSQLTPTAR